MIRHNLEHANARLPCCKRWVEQAKAALNNNGILTQILMQLRWDSIYNLPVTLLRWLRLLLGRSSIAHPVQLRPPALTPERCIGRQACARACQRL